MNETEESFNQNIYQLEEAEQASNIAQNINPVMYNTVDGPTGAKNTRDLWNQEYRAPRTGSKARAKLPYQKKLKSISVKSKGPQRSSNTQWPSISTYTRRLAPIPSPVHLNTVKKNPHTGSRTRIRKDPLSNKKLTNYEKSPFKVETIGNNRSRQAGKEIATTGSTLQ